MEQTIVPGKWRLRLIGSSSSLMAPRGAKTEINAAFNIREIRDYYVPNEKKTILRYKVAVNEDRLTSLQLTTSKTDVYIKLTIYDNGVEVFSTTGKGIAAIPAFIFLKDRLGDAEQTATSIQSRPGSKTSNFKDFYIFS
jgi:hypothetical protein